MAQLTGVGLDVILKQFLIREFSGDLMNFLKFGLW